MPPLFGYEIINEITSFVSTVVMVPIPSTPFFAGEKHNFVFGARKRQCSEPTLTGEPQKICAHTSWVVWGREPDYIKCDILCCGNKFHSKITKRTKSNKLRGETAVKGIGDNGAEEVCETLFLKRSVKIFRARNFHSVGGLKNSLQHEIPPPRKIVF